MPCPGVEAPVSQREERVRRMDQADTAYQPWGKLSREREGTGPRWHPLVDHMTDVAACLAALSSRGAIRRAMERAAGRPLDEVDEQRLAVIAFLHDIGKANAGFQSRWWVLPHRPPGRWPTFPVGHSAEGWVLFDAYAHSADARAILSGLPLQAMTSWGDAALWELMKASISHHGRPVRDIGFQNVAALWHPVLSEAGETLYRPADVVADMGRRVQQLFPLAFDDTGHVPLPDAPAFGHLFAGLVQLADWLGSDTRAHFFPYSQPGEDRAITAANGAQYAVRAIGLDTTDARSVFTSRAPTFTDAFEVSAPRPMQSEVADTEKGPLVILEAETGSGKTEAALWRFAKLYEAGRVDSLFFALPTRVAATQIYERVCAFVGRLWPHDAPVVVRALPGYEAADGERKVSLPDFKVQWPDDPADAVAHKRWVAESPKRFLAATIAVGTVDQALLAALMVRHAHLRHALLTRSLLVVDEVHASDAYMSVLLEKLLKAHLHAGGEALLLSATLGAVARQRFLSAASSQRERTEPSLVVACALPYPLISAAGTFGQCERAVQGNPRMKRVLWRTFDALDDPVQIATLATNAAAQGARVLVVRNTVPTAVATLKEIESRCADAAADWLFRVAGTSTLHHSRFSRSDRPLLDAEVERQLGKQRVDRSARIIVGTQTLEQSLDIDADLLITDLCPMDVLLQRLGRLHRHERCADERPAAFRTPRAWVLTPPGHDLAPMLKRARFGLGLMRGRDGVPGGVYPDLRILEATRRLIETRPQPHIPADNRQLVEHATHPEALAAIEQEMQGDWPRLGQELDGLRVAQRSIGHLQTLAFDRHFSEAGFPDAEQHVATRLGAADRLLTLPDPIAGPFGQPVQQLALRHHQVPSDLSPDTQPSELQPLPTGGFEFDLGKTRFRYSRFGLARLPRAHESASLKDVPHE
jgi:CRISPR-associated endonuclease/helicase Cas3